MSLPSMVVDAHLEAVSFSLYSDAEIRALSVKRVSVFPALDPQGIAVSGGLYDPAMGPLDLGESCVTCGLMARFCPGHSGHIELPVPVVNPLLANTVYRIMRSLCFNCHNFCVPEGKEWRLAALALQLRLLGKGCVVEAASITSADEFKAAAARFTPAVLDALRASSGDSIMAAKLRASLVDELVSKRTTRCSFCTAVSPVLRKHGAAAGIYCRPLEPAQLLRNARNSVKIEDDVFLQPVYGQPDPRSSADLGALDTCREQRWLSPLELKEHMRRAWARNPELCALVWNHMHDQATPMQRAPTSHEAFFMSSLLVASNRFRPPTRSADGGRSMMNEHPHNMHLQSVLQTMAEMEAANVAAKADAASKVDEEDSAATTTTTTSSSSSNNTLVAPKANIASLWMKLQGAVGIYFSQDVSGPTDAVTTFAGLKQLLEKKEGLFRRNMMGKRVNYAARTVISPDPLLETDEIGVPLVFATRLTFPTRVTPQNHRAMVERVVNGCDVHPGATAVEVAGRVTSLRNMKHANRVALSRNLLNHEPAHPEETAIVHAHLSTGDVVLVNRQPSLHKPSMMGHRVKVLGRERTLRMHYANCSTYNADFDGDEMNIHLPQSHEARADLRYIATNRNQYLSAKDGQPLRGLIQDHVLSGVLLTMRDKFFTRTEYQRLLYGAMWSVRPLDDIVMDTPCIIKPQALWSGKQLVSGLVKHLLHGKPLFNYRGGSRVKWDDPYEDAVVFRGAELMTGVIDKAQCGATTNGFVHACYSLYGGDIAERLLSCMGRLFTLYLQQHGFTCGMDDFLLTREAEAERRKVLSEAGESSKDALRSFLRTHAPSVSVDAAASADVLARKLQAHLESVPTDEAQLDNAMKQVSHALTSRVVKVALPRGLKKAFPRNNFQLMTVSGAKGSDVNFSMIGCCLGQMELEGRRVARIVSGRTLPSFKPFQVDVVAGGFIGQRFLTGVRPQEFYFHCMAGREGLVDTAVKTSRSGYLQRCIIKHLETLVVGYDGTVRDSDGSIVQFQYGDDGLDPTHYRTITNVELLRANTAILERRLRAADKRLPRQLSAPLARYHALPAAARDRTALTRLPTAQLGMVSDRFLQLLEDDAARTSFASTAERERFRRLACIHYFRGVVPPGEAVGVLAGQSIGEPSTQMTLNTFHLAGHGNVNVTLGIPRLRELLMVGGHPALPSMSLPFVASATAHDVDATKAAWLNAPLDKVFCETVIRKQLPVGSLYYTDTLYMKLRDDVDVSLSWRALVRVVCTEYVPLLVKQIRGDIKRKAAYNSIRTDLAAEKEGEEGGEDGEDSAGEAEEVDKEADARPRQAKGKKKKGKSRTEREADSAAAEIQSGGDDDDDNVEEEAFVEQHVPEKCAKEAAGVYVSSIAALRTRTERVVRVVICSRAAGDQILMSSIVEATLSKQLVRRLPGIQRAVFSQDTAGGAAAAAVPSMLMLTEGANALLLAPWVHLLRVTQLKCNDIQHLLDVYGVEVARAALVEEIAAVFQAYGISVNYRHLALIADYMTFQGEFRAFNRHAIGRGKDSPFLRMSFETTVDFALRAAVNGESDSLTSPSAQLVVGTLPRVGTGCMDVLQPLHLP